MDDNSFLGLQTERGMGMAMARNAEQTRGARNQFDLAKVLRTLARDASNPPAKQEYKGQPEV